MLRQTLTALGVCLTALPALAQEAAPLGAGLIDLRGKQVGTASIRPTPGGVLVEVAVNGLPPLQWHAFHVHEGGSCDTANGFKSAGGHFAPTGNPHGFLMEGGPHAGDMPNQYVAADGRMSAEIYNDRLSIGEGDNSVRGRTLIVHGGRDDYTSQPSGNAGDRLVCGVIK